MQRDHWLNWNMTLCIQQSLIKTSYLISPSNKCKFDWNNKEIASTLTQVTWKRLRLETIPKTYSRKNQVVMYERYVTKMDLTSLSKPYRVAEWLVLPYIH